MPDVLVTREGGLARVTLDRPPLNILSPGLIDELGAVFRALAGEPGVRVVVLAGNGRAFSAGVEVQAMRDLDPRRARALIGRLHATIAALRDLDAVVVARLHGHVLGGALELVLGADLRVAGESCRLGMPEIRVGIPSVIEAALLPGLIGWGRTAELLLTGETIDAARAEGWGLVNRVVPDAALDGEVEAWAARLLALPADACRLQKQLLRRWRQVDLDSAIALSMDAFARAYATEEPRRAMQAFLDRRRSLPMTDSQARPPLAVLAGVRVLSFTQFLLGPSGVQFIADLGADVIKIEPTGGTLWERNWAGCDLYLNGVSSFFLSTHRNQRSLAVDLKHPEGQAIARRLIEGADVLVQNFRPGVMERLGLGWEAAAALNPRLIYVSASGYGSQSPYRDRPGQDLLLQAMSGLAHISGRAGQPPTPVGTAVVDQHGATLLAMGVLAALLERGRTGRGLHVEVSMLRAALDLQLEIVTYFLNGARMEKSPTSLASMFHPGPYGVYATQDGHVVLSMSPLGLLQEALDLPALAPYTRVPFDFEHREEIARLLEPVMRTRPTRAWVDLLVPRGVWAAPVLTHAETFADPAVAAADCVEEVDHPVAGRVRLLRFPLELSTGRAAARRPAPMPGEQTDEILGELGYGEAERRRLREQGVV